MKSLGTLKYHKSGCQVLEFARCIVTASISLEDGEDDDSEDEMSEKEKAERGRWLVGGGKDSRISMWSLMSFTKT
jgi:hypothetical protein